MLNKNLIESEKLLLKKLKSNLNTLNKNFISQKLNFTLIDYQKVFCYPFEYHFKVHYYCTEFIFNSLFKIENNKITDITIKRLPANKQFNINILEDINNKEKEFISILKNIKLTDINKYFSEQNDLNILIKSKNDTISKLKKELANNTEKSNFQQIENYFTFVSEKHVDDFIDNLILRNDYQSFEIIILETINNTFYFKKQKFNTNKEKKRIFFDEHFNSVISLKNLKQIMKKQVFFSFINNEKVKVIQDLDCLILNKKGLVRNVEKYELIKQLNMLNNIKNF
jgi:hypothetical protein